MAAPASQVADALGTCRILTNEISGFDLQEQARISHLLARANERHALTLFGLRTTNAHILAAQPNSDDPTGELFARMVASDESIDSEIHSSVLNFAAREDNIALAKDLLSRGADPRLGAVHIAATQGSLRVLDLLIASDASLARHADEQSTTPLILAARHGAYDACGILLPLSDELALDANGRTAFATAVSCGAIECARMLATPAALAHAAANPDSSGHSLPHLAALCPDKRVDDMIELVAPHCDWRAMNPKGQSALMVAAARGNRETISVLATHCDPAWVDFKGRTAFMLACKHSNAAAFEALLPVSDPWQRDFYGRDSLDFAEFHDKPLLSADPEATLSRRLENILATDRERAELRAATERPTMDDGVASAPASPKPLRI
jgi:ankyrin repeat protein